MEMIFKSKETPQVIPPNLLYTKALFDKRDAVGSLAEYNEYIRTKIEKTPRVFDSSNAIIRIELTGQDISEIIQSAVKNVIAKEMQPGGLLYKMNKETT